MEYGERDGKSLVDAMDQGDMEGMQTFDGVIEKLVRDGVVKKDEGLAFATNPGNLLLRLSDLGGSASASKVSPNGDSMLDLIE
jgi:twitching motility protein PilT